MRHVWLKGKVTHSEKTSICVSDRYKFSPHSLQTTHLLISFNSRGKIFKGGELETTVRVISHQKKLQDNPVSSETPV